MVTSIFLLLSVLVTITSSVFCHEASEGDLECETRCITKEARPCTRDPWIYVKSSSKCDLLGVHQEEGIKYICQKTHIAASISPITVAYMISAHGLEYKWIPPSKYKEMKIGTVWVSIPIDLKFKPIDRTMKWPYNFPLRFLGPAYQKITNENGLTYQSLFENGEFESLDTIATKVGETVSRDEAFQEHYAAYGEEFEAASGIYEVIIDPSGYVKPQATLLRLLGDITTEKYVKLTDIAEMLNKRQPGPIYWNACRSISPLGSELWDHESTLYSSLDKVDLKGTKLDEWRKEWVLKEGQKYVKLLKELINERRTLWHTLENEKQKHFTLISDSKKKGISVDERSKDKKKVAKVLLAFRKYVDENSALCKIKKIKKIKKSKKKVMHDRDRIELCLKQFRLWNYEELMAQARRQIQHLKAEYHIKQEAMEEITEKYNTVPKKKEPDLIYAPVRDFIMVEGGGIQFAPLRPRLGPRSSMSSSSSSSFDDPFFPAHLESGNYLHNGNDNVIDNTFLHTHAYDGSYRVGYQSLVLFVSGIITILFGILCILLCCGALCVSLYCLQTVQKQ